MEGIGRFLADRRTVRVCQIATGVVFALSGLAKVGDLRAFAEQIHNFRVVPVATEHLLAMTLPWIELVAAGALILGVRARHGAVLASIALTLFTVAVLVAMARGLDVDCGCFGTAKASRVGIYKVLENLGFLALALVGSLRPR
jgi:uncharacterized membrane protein YphA (DoxX/SURF4 family)